MPQKIFDNDLVAIHKSKIRIMLDKPAYVEMHILGLSEALMHQFHYDYIKNKYGNKSRLSFTDSDSLLYKIKTEVVYENFSKDKKRFDCGSCSANSNDINMKEVASLVDKFSD